MLLNLPPFSSVLGLNRKRPSFSGWSLIFLITLCFLFNYNQAGVIKISDINTTETPSVNTVFESKEADVGETLLTQQYDASNATFSIKLQTIADANLVTESSKELSNNEVLINEAKQLKEGSDITQQTKNNTLTKINNEMIEAKTQGTFTQPLEAKQEKVQDLSENTKDFNSNDIKEEKLEKLREKSYENLNQNEQTTKDQGNTAVLENKLNKESNNQRFDYVKEKQNAKFKQESENKTSLSLNLKETGNLNLKPDSEFSKDLEPVTNLPVIKSLKENKPLDNSIENSQENVGFTSETKATTISPDKNSISAIELTTLTALLSRENKLLETTANVFVAEPKAVETSFTKAEETESLEILNKNSIVPFKDSNKVKQIESLDNNLNPKNQDKEQNEGNINETTPKVSLSTKTIENEEGTLVFEEDKKEHGRSMFKEDVTTPKEEEVNGEFDKLEKKPVQLSVKEGIKELPIAQTFNMKEKKPKFINDNSTNAQQLNLPNNAEVWSLAGMKSLPSTNVTMETAHAHHNNSLQEVKMQQNSTSTLINNNSEKTLLDWSQIMMDKDLAVTTRNEQPAELLESHNGSSFFAEKPQFHQQPEQEVITKNSLLEKELFSTNTMSTPVLTTTTLLALTKNPENNNENLNLADKKVEENMNNHIETLTVTFASTNVDNNPFNATLNIEPNLNEINLTSNQTKDDLNNEQQYTTTETTTAGAQTASNDVKINKETSTSTPATTTTTPALTTSTMSTLSTTATAVSDDLTTVEQISSETTTVSIVETTKENASLITVVNEEQQLQQEEISNKTYNVNKEKTNSASHYHNELDNNILDNKNQFKQNEFSDNVVKATTTTTVIPITTFRPNNLAISSIITSSKNDETFEQEVDQKNNEIQTNSTTNTQQQSIIKFDLPKLNIITTQKTIDYKTTLETLMTTAATTTEYLTTTTETSKNENSHTLSPKESETTTTTSFSEEVIINETTETNIRTSEQTTTPKQETEQKNTEIETTTGSAVFIEDKKFENKEYPYTTTETNVLAKTLTETPVGVLSTEKEQEIYKSSTTTTERAATATTEVFTQPTTLSTTTEQLKHVTQESNLKQNQGEDVLHTTTAAIIIMNNTQETTTTSKTTTISSPITAATTMKEEETYISLLDDTTTARATTTTSAEIETHSNASTTTSSDHLTTLSKPLSSSTLPTPITTKIEEIYNVINSTTTEVVQTTTQQLLTEIIEEETTTSSQTEIGFLPSTTTIANLKEMLPPATTPSTTTISQMRPTNDINHSLPTLTSIIGGNSGNMYTKNSQASGETDVNVIIAITVSVIGVIALILLVGFLYLMRKRQKQTSYSQRCRPVSMEDYTIDNVSVGGSMRKSGALRASKRTYGNLAFDDPTLRHNPLGVQELAKFAQEKLQIFEEFRDVPQITSRLDEVPNGCEDKNRYANVLPLPETRVILQRLNDDEKSEYINANYVTGPKDPPNYYIACQAPLESTVEDFWRMIWEQQSRVIIQATDLIEFGVEKCAEYLPPSATLDNHSSFGDFQITLQNREVKDKYAISTLLLKHVTENATRELTHYWYKWPEVGVPAEEAPIIAMLLEARSSLISYAIEQANEDKEKSSAVATLKSAEEGTVTTASNSTAELSTNNLNSSSTNNSTGEINGNISMVHIKKTARNQGPLTIHCSPGTGRTGTIIACDIALRSLETPKRIVDIPQIVYSVRRGRASAVLTKEQYEFIYKVANMYAAKITNPTNYN